MYETPRMERVDIDDQAGWDTADAIARQRLSGGSGAGSR
jgi:hypothetical protein